MRKRGVWSALGAAIAVFAVSGMAMASTFTNGAFSGLSGVGFETLCAGTSSATAISGWTVSSGSVDWISSYWSNPAGTANSLDMNGSTPCSPLAGTITQTFATTVNSTYFVSFALSGNPVCGELGIPSPATKTLYVSSSAANAPTTAYSFDTATAGNTPSNMDWQTTGYSFVASGDSTTLTFAADPTNASACGPALGDVSISETAATGANCKDGGWQAMFESNGTPFTNQGDCVSYYAISGDTPIGP